MNLSMTSTVCYLLIILVSLAFEVMASKIRVNREERMKTILIAPTFTSPSPSPSSESLLCSSCNSHFCIRLLFCVGKSRFDSSIE